MILVNLSQNQAFEKPSDELHRVVSTTSRWGAIGVFLFSGILHLFIFRSVALSDPDQGIWLYILGALLGIFGIRITLRGGDEGNKRVLRNLGIYIFLPLILIISIVFFFDPTYSFYIIFGFMPSFLLSFIRVSPYAIIYTTVPTGKGYILTKETDYVIVNAKTERDIPYDTQIEVKVEGRGVSSIASGQNYYHMMYFHNNSKEIDPIQFALLNHRGLPLLGLICELFPNSYEIKVSNLDRSLGGILSIMEPKAGTAEVVTPPSSDIGNPLSISRFEECMDHPKYQESRQANPVKLFLIITWGCIFSAFILGFLILSAAFSYFSLISDGGFLEITVPATFALVAVAILLFSGRVFILYPLIHIIGKWVIVETENDFVIKKQRLGLSSNSIKLPKILDPRLILEDQTIFIVCQDDESIYYRLKLGKIKE